LDLLPTKMAIATILTIIQSYEAHWRTMDDCPSTHKNANHANNQQSLNLKHYLWEEKLLYKLSCVCRVDNHGSILNNKRVWSRTGWRWKKGCGRRGHGIKKQCSAIAIKGHVPSPSAQRCFMKRERARTQRFWEGARDWRFFEWQKMFSILKEEFWKWKHLFLLFHY
jgi:hypothetical protein